MPNGPTPAVTFTPWGQCTLAADTNTLTLRIEATGEDGLHQMRDVITRDLERFSRRNPLTVTWRQLETRDTPARIKSDGAAPQHRRGAVHGRLRALLLAVAVILVIALHLGLAGTIAADSKWTGMATNVVVALVVLKIALIALACLGIRRRNAPPFTTMACPRPTDCDPLCPAGDHDAFADPDGFLISPSEPDLTADDARYASSSSASCRCRRPCRCRALPAVHRHGVLAIARGRV